MHTIILFNPSYSLILRIASSSCLRPYFPVVFSLSTISNRHVFQLPPVGIDKNSILNRKSPLRAPVETNKSCQANRGSLFNYINKEKSGRNDLNFRIPPLFHKEVLLSPKIRARQNNSCPLDSAFATACLRQEHHGFSGSLFLLCLRPKDLPIADSYRMDSVSLLTSSLRS